MPPGVSVEFDSDALRRLGADIRRAGRSERRRLTAALAAVGEGGARERIHAGGPSPDGAAWQKRRSHSTKPLLVQSGHLARSITSTSTANMAEWGSRRVYARIHQLGGQVRPRRAQALRFMVGGKAVFARKVFIPARPYLGWGPAEREQADMVVERWLDRAFPGNGGAA